MLTRIRVGNEEKVCIAIMRKGEQGPGRNYRLGISWLMGAIEKAGEKKVPKGFIGILQEGHEQQVATQ